MTIFNNSYVKLPEGIPVKQPVYPIVRPKSMEFMASLPMKLSTFDVLLLKSPSNPHQIPIFLWGGWFFPTFEIPCQGNWTPRWNGHRRFRYTNGLPAKLGIFATRIEGDRSLWLVQKGTPCYTHGIIWDLPRHFPKPHGTLKMEL